MLGAKLLPRGPLPLNGLRRGLLRLGRSRGAAIRAGGALPRGDARELPTLSEAGVQLDLLVGSANDPGERYDGSLTPPTLVLTEGPRGGTANGMPYAAGTVARPGGRHLRRGRLVRGSPLLRARARRRPAAALELAARAGAAVVDRGRAVRDPASVGRVTARVAWI